MDTSVSEAWRDLCVDALPSVADRRKRAVNGSPGMDTLGLPARERRGRMGHVGRPPRAAAVQIVLFSVYCTVGQGLWRASRQFRDQLARLVTREPGGAPDVPQPERRRPKGAPRADIVAGIHANGRQQQVPTEGRADGRSNGLVALALNLSPLPSITATLPEAGMAAFFAASPARDCRANHGALRTLLVFSLALAPPLVAQPSQGHRAYHVNVYRRLTTSSLRGRGPDPLQGNEDHAAVVALRSASGPDTTGLAQAASLFDRHERAGAVGQGQGHLASKSSRWLLTTRSTPGHAVDRQDSDTLACRARRGFERLHAGQLAAAQSELADPAFAHSEPGITLRRALAQRAICLGEDARAMAQFGWLDAAGQLRADERSQWFALLLQAGRLDQAHRLQAQGGLDMPQQQLALANAWADRGELASVAAYMAERRPDFTREAQERQWLYLLAYLERQRPELLRDYQVRFAANREVQSRLLLPVVPARGSEAGTHVQQTSFRQARFGLVLRAGRFGEAARLAEAMLAAPGGAALLEPLSQQLIEAGAPSHAQALLLRA